MHQRQSSQPPYLFAVPVIRCGRQRDGQWYGIDMVKEAILSAICSSHAGFEHPDIVLQLNDPDPQTDYFLNQLVYHAPTPVIDAEHKTRP